MRHRSGIESGWDMCDTQEVLFVDGDERQARSVNEVLLRAGYSVERHESGSAAMRRLTRALPAIVVLEQRLPDVDGLEVLAWIRARFPDLPVIVLGHAVLEQDAVSALRAGADDFVRKPVLEDEFVARIAALIRRYRRPMVDVIEFGSLVVDMRIRDVTVSGDPVRLTPIEYQIVELLARNAGMVIQREAIASRVWGRSIDEAVSRSLDTHIYRIRQKLRLHKSSGLVLRSAYTLGYQLEYVNRDSSNGKRSGVNDHFAGRIVG
ncbi:response regulator transcription factor [Burkholderia pyrrocinia]|uniref:response regulator transcription factor n=1 Tax=Burkholderia pyrrocinia TaxID=60550 RepID=UPI00215B6D7C|nr:response regulator transcription factor [Burkholderia pyrrocinia]UVE69064.1 response regulator transcription factor [Burkholderia pyrrocinia]